MLQIGLQVVYEEIDAEFLVHDGQRSVALEARADQSRKEDLFKLLVAKVWEWEVAELLEQWVLSTAELLLVTLIQESEVSYHQDDLMQELLSVFMLVVRFNSVNKETVKQVIELLAALSISDELLHEFVAAGRHDALA